MNCWKQEGCDAGHCGGRGERRERRNGKRQETMQWTAPDDIHTVPFGTGRTIICKHWSNILFRHQPTRWMGTTIES